MVNRGRPSQGCLLCRQRRIKCDETKPACTQCTRRNRQCPGYKHLKDAAARGEPAPTDGSAALVPSKSNKPAASAGHSRDWDSNISTPKSDYSWGSSEVSVISSNTSYSSGSASSSSQYIQRWGGSSDRDRALSPPVPNALDFSLEQQALCHFLANWILIHPEGTSHGYMECTVPLIEAALPESAFGSCIKATAMASLATKPHSKSLLPQATMHYAKALSTLNAALRDPVMAYQDQTLAAVITLGLYETLTSTRIQTASWQSHIDGAVALCKARGPPKTPMARELHSIVRGQMLVSRMVNTKAPELNDDWWISRDSEDEQEQAGARLNLRVAQLRADAEMIFALPMHAPQTVEQVKNLKLRSEILEDDIQKWEASLPSPWRGKTVAWHDEVTTAREAAWFDEIPQTFLPVETQRPYPGKIDLYTDMWVANFRNIARTSRLLVLTTIIRCTAWLCPPEDYRITPDYARAMRASEEIITDILASVCNFLDLDWQKWKIEDASLNNIDGLGQPFSPPKFPVGDSALGNRGVAGLFLLWPLISAASSDYCTSSQREWIKGKLRFMGETMGINRATILSRVEIRLPSMVIKRDAANMSSGPVPYSFPAVL